MALGVAASEYLRGPHSIAFDITNRCNLRCLHCFNSSGENSIVAEELSGCEVMSFIHNLVEMQIFSLCFCGGETLLRAPLMTRALKELTAADVKCNIVSNGLLASRALIDDLVEAGLSGIQFSLDGTEKSHDLMRGKKGAFKRTIDILSYVLGETSLNISVAFTPTSFNVRDFRQLYFELVSLQNDLRDDRGAASSIDLRVQPLMLLGRARANSWIEPNVVQYRELVAEIDAVDADAGGASGVNITWGDPVDHIIRFANSDYCMDQINIRANGDIVPSAYLPLVVGNIRKHTLLEYWDAGLGEVWQKNVVRYMAQQLRSVRDMESLSSKYTDINMGDDFFIDLIDNNLDDLSLIR